MNIMQIQARIYWRLIRQLMDKDEYFKDFTLKDFRFIVVNTSCLEVCRKLFFGRPEDRKPCSKRPGKSGRRTHLLS